MSSDGTTLLPPVKSSVEEEALEELSSKSSLQKVRDLGASPLGESFEVLRIFEAEEEGEEARKERFVLKKISRAQIRDPERFQQKFDSLRRLEHPHLCPYRELYLGEKAARLTRTYVEGLPLDAYVLQPITPEEEELLREQSDLSSPAIPLDSFEENRGEDLPLVKGAENDEQEAPQQEEEERKEATKPISPESIALGEENGEGSEQPPLQNREAASESLGDESAPPAFESDEEDRPSTLEIPSSLLESSEAADRALDLVILRLRKILPQLLDALEYLHRFRHVHGALKPENIFITCSEELILTDYGIHKEVEIAASQDYLQSHRAPGQGEAPITAATDLYALGSILFELLSGRGYGEDRREEAPRYLSEILPHCPASWADLIHGLLHGDHDERLTLKEVRQQLAISEDRSVTIPASVVDEKETLFGRQQTLARLTDLAKQASQSRRLTITLVEGDLGVGKTALVDGLARWAAQLGWIVLHGRCYQSHNSLFQGWDEIIDRLSALLIELPEKSRRRLSEARRRAAQLFPQLAEEGAREPEVQWDRRSALLGLREILERLSDQRPILLCFDDLHWAGDDSLRLLADLCEEPDNLRVLCAATHPGADKSEKKEKSRILEELSSSPVIAERILIDGFSKREARDYVLANANHLTLPQKQRILRTSGLNPLLIDELIYEQHGPEKGASRDQSDNENDDNTNPRTKDDAKEGDALQVANVEGQVSHFVEQRLAELNRPERLALQLLVVAHGPLSASLLGRALGRELGTQGTDPLDGKAVAEALVARRLARKTRERTDENTPARYVVIHELCRETIQRELGRDHHSRLCGLIGDSISQEHPEAAELQFQYFRRAGRIDEAAKAARKAARRALSRHAFFQARNVLSWLQEQELLEDKGLVELASATEGCEDYAAAAELYGTLIKSGAASLSLSADDLSLRQIQALLCAGRRKEAGEVLGITLKNITGSSLQKLLSGSDLLFLRKRLLLSLSRWSDPSQIAAPSPNEQLSPEAKILDFLLQGAPFLLPGAGKPLSDRLGHIAHQLRSPELLAQDRLAMIGSPWLPFLSRESGNHLRWIEQALELTKKEGQKKDRNCATEVRIREMEALLGRQRGDYQKCTDSLREAEGLLRRCPNTPPLLWLRLQCLAMETAFQKGDLLSGEERLTRLLHRYRNHPWFRAYLQLGKIRLHELRGTFDEIPKSLAHLEKFIGEEKNCSFHLAFIEARATMQVALGQAEVAVAQWDLLRDEVYSRQLLQTPAARFIISRSLAVALSARAAREKDLKEPRYGATLRRLFSTLRALSDLSSRMGALEKAQWYRLQARAYLLRDRPQKALKAIEKAESTVGTEFFLARYSNLEARGIILKTLEDPAYKACLDEARKGYAQGGLYLPLLLEGWSVPRSHALLKVDP